MLFVFILNIYKITFSLAVVGHHGANIADAHRHVLVVLVSAAEFVLMEWLEHMDVKVSPGRKYHVMCKTVHYGVFGVNLRNVQEHVMEEGD